MLVSLSSIVSVEPWPEATEARLTLVDGRVLWVPEGYASLVARIRGLCGADGLCDACGEPFPCPTGLAIYEAVKRELEHPTPPHGVFSAGERPVDSASCLDSLTPFSGQPRTGGLSRPAARVRLPERAPGPGFWLSLVQPATAPQGPEAARPRLQPRGSLRGRDPPRAARPTSCSGRCRYAVVKYDCTPRVPSGS